MDVLVSGLLPLRPRPADDVVRIVRHGLADVLDWLGEDVGPRPGEAVHAIRGGRMLLVSQEMFDRLTQKDKP